MAGAIHPAADSARVILVNRIRHPHPVPQERTLVFAAANGTGERGRSALADLKVEALMWSASIPGYLPKIARDTPIYDAYPNYRFLDSGVFTLIQESETTQRERKSMGAEKKHKRKVTPQLIEEEFRRYLAYLEEHHEWFDFLIEFDVDTIPAGGPDATRRYREELFDLLGTKLLPVWHIPQGEAGFTDLLKRFPYVALGSSVGLRSDLAQRLCGQAHAAGVKVHGLGTGDVALLGGTALDTADSTQWLAAARWGHYAAGMVIGVREQKSSASLSRALRLQQMVTEMGLDPNDLVVGGHNKTKFLLAIGLVQQQQAAWRAMPRNKSVTRTSLF